MTDNKPDKGKENGSCNRTACQAPLADEPTHQFMARPFTSGEYLYYCARCAFTFDQVDEDNRRRGASVLPNRITREPKEAAAVVLVGRSLRDIDSSNIV
jgi:hypothetical protein